MINALLYWPHFWVNLISRRSYLTLSHKMGYTQYCDRSHSTNMQRYDKPVKIQHYVEIQQYVKIQQYVRSLQTLPCRYVQHFKPSAFLYKFTGLGGVRVSC